MPDRCFSACLKALQKFLSPFSTWPTCLIEHFLMSAQRVTRLFLTLPREDVEMCCILPIYNPSLYTKATVMSPQPVLPFFSLLSFKVFVGLWWLLLLSQTSDCCCCLFYGLNVPSNFCVLILMSRFGADMQRSSQILPNQRTSIWLSSV